eukprot:5525915-Pyramimonas_sp.AAC.2
MPSPRDRGRDRIRRYSWSTGRQLTSPNNDTHLDNNDGGSRQQPSSNGQNNSNGHSYECPDASGTDRNGAILDNGAASTRFLFLPGRRSDGHGVDLAPYYHGLSATAVRI